MQSLITLTAIEEKIHSPKTRVLLIEDDEAEHLWVSEQLKENAPAFNLVCMDTLQKGMEHLSREGADVVLLDLYLPDSRGIETFHQLHSLVKRIPIVILTGLDDEGSGLEAIRKGAQDYLVKGEVNGKALSRVIQYALQRHDRRAGSRNPMLTDDLTGLYNRQGFLVMAERYLKAAERANRGFFISCVVLDNLKDINVSHGQAESDLAVGTAAKILGESFRTSDLIARVGRDRFAVITSETSPHTPKIFKNRLQKSQTYYNSQFNQYKLSISVCAAPIDQTQIRTMQDLSEKTDKIFSDYARVNEGMGEPT